MYRIVLAVVFSLLAVDVLATNTGLAGRWRGEYETPQGLGRLELTLSRQGSEWKGVCKFPDVDDEENTFPAQELKVSETELSFSIEVENHSGKLSFKGKPAGEKIEGTFERFIEGRSEYSGGWSIERTK